jgi:DNA-binding NtrC family response regulator
MTTKPLVVLPVEFPCHLSEDSLPLGPSLSVRKSTEDTPLNLRSSVLIGNTPVMRAIEADVRDAARSDAKVLITGQSGVGKEIIASLIHQHSARNRAPLLTLNSAGIPDTLLESELFGHMRGSFTGAYRDKPGLFESARGGTVLLDEIGEMSLRMQGVLLRFLETGEIQPVGADKPRFCSDVRIIASTHRRLVDQIASKAFREDLYYRLNVIHIMVPPLRERQGDIPSFVRHFIKVFSEQHRVPPIEIAAETMTRLVEYEWPGNVRELRNVIERLQVRSKTGAVLPHDLPPEISRASTADVLVEGETREQQAADVLYDRIVKGGESFWSVVYAPFMAHDLTRAELRRVVTLGLTHTKGNYTALLQLFNMKAGDYKRFLNFLRKNQCSLPYQHFRVARVPSGERANQRTAS